MINQINSDFLFLSIITVAIPLFLGPIFMLNKSKKYYDAAKREGRTRAFNDRGPSPVEEEYKTDAIMLTVLLSGQFIIMIIFLWK